MDEVRIPIFLDFDDSDFENEITKLRPKLDKLKDNVNNILKSRSQNIELFDMAKLTLADRTLVHIRDKIQKIGKENISSDEWENLVSLYKDAAGCLDNIINKYDKLKEAMSPSTGTSSENWKNITNAKELTQYTDALQRKLNQVKQTLQENPTRGNDVLEQTKDRIEKNIEALNEYIKKIGEVTQELADAEMKANKATKFSTEAKRARKNGEDWATSDVVAQAKLDAKAARDYYSELERTSGEATAKLKQDVRERMSAVIEEEENYRQVASHINEQGEYLRSAKNWVAEQRESKAEVAKQTEEEAVDTTKEQIKALKQEQAEVKQSASQYYYKLRALKMTSFVFGNITRTTESFGKTALSVASKSLNAYLKLIPGVSQLQKALSKAGKSQRDFSKHMKESSKSSSGFNFTLKDLLKNLMRYGLGIRSLFVLVNKLRSAVINGFNDMVKVYEPVNRELSSISTSLLQMRNAVSAAVEPMLSVLAPALERIAAIVSDLAYKVASFIAALTGKSVVIKATRAQVDYAKSLDKTGKSASKARKELAAFDELNILHPDEDSGSGDGGAGAMFEEVPIDPIMSDWADKFKEFLDRLLGPIKRAWERVKDYVTNAFKFMCQQLLALWKDMARDFWRVWEEFKTEQIFYYFFLALGDIMLIVGSLAKKIREAWNYMENGYRILKAIRDIIYDVVYHFRQMTAYTRDWVERELNLKPLFTAIADVLEKDIEPAINRILGLIEYLYTMGFLELLRDFINNNLPTLVKGLGEIIDGFGLIARRLQTALETGTKVDKKLKYTRSRLQQIIDKVEYFARLISETFKTMAKDFKDWANNLDFRAFFDACIQFLNDITPMVRNVLDIVEYLWKNAVLPFWKYLVEDGGPKLIKIFGQIFGEYDPNTGMGIDWEKFTKNMKDFIDTLAPFFELAWETLLQIIKDLGKAFDDFINSDTMQKIIGAFKDWVQNADPEELAHKLETFAEIFLGLLGAFKLVNDVFIPFAVTWGTFHNLIMQGQMTAKLGEIAGALSTAGTEAGTLATNTGKVIGDFNTLPGAAAGTLTTLGTLVGLIADIFLAIEVNKMKALHDEITALPQTSSDLNGVNVELDRFQNLLKNIYEILHPGETLGDKIVGPSDYEKLENMRDKLNTMGQEMENDGKLSDEMAQKIEDAFGILGDNIDTVENLTDEQVQAFSDLYKEVEDYYNVCEDKVPKIQILWETFLDVIKGLPEVIGNASKLLNFDIIRYIKQSKEGIDEYGNTVEQKKFTIGDTINFWKERLFGTKTATEELDTTTATATTNMKTNLDSAAESTEKLEEVTKTVTKTTKDNYAEAGEQVTVYTGTLTKSVDEVNTAVDESKSNVSAYSDSAVESLDKIDTKTGDIKINFTEMAQMLQLQLDGLDLVMQTWIETVATTYFGIDKWKTLLIEGPLNALNDFFAVDFTAAWETNMQTWWTSNVIPWFTGANKWQTELFTPLMTYIQSRWNALLTWFDTAMNDWWNSHVAKWFKQDEWQKLFNFILLAAQVVMPKVRDEISDRINEAAEAVVNACAIMEEALSGILELIGSVSEQIGSITSTLTGLSGSFSFTLGGSSSGGSSGGAKSFMPMLDVLHFEDNLGMSAFKFPELANGAVIPPNDKFLAVLGDQRSGTNIEAPLDTIKQALSETLSDMMNNVPQGDIVLQIDGYEVFRAVRNQSDLFRNSTGYSVL